MIPFPFVNGHDDESRASTMATATSLDPETLNHENPSREVHSGFLDLPSPSQTHIRYSVTEFNEHIDEISADEGMVSEVTSCAISLTSTIELLYEMVPTHPPFDSRDINTGSESTSTEQVVLIKFLWLTATSLSSLQIPLASQVQRLISERPTLPMNHLLPHHRFCGQIVNNTSI